MYSWPELVLNSSAVAGLDYRSVPYHNLTQHKRCSAVLPARRGREGGHLWDSRDLRNVVASTWALRDAWEQQLLVPLPLLLLLGSREVTGAVNMSRLRGNSVIWPISTQLPRPWEELTQSVFISSNPEDIRLICRYTILLLLSEVWETWNQSEV